MKNLYISPNIRIVNFVSEDVLAVSGQDSYTTKGFYDSNSGEGFSFIN